MRIIRAGLRRLVLVFADIAGIAAGTLAILPRFHRPHSRTRKFAPVRHLAMKMLLLPSADYWWVA